METSQNLLVALMFVTILTLGIANLITALSSAVVSRDRGERRLMRTGWKVALLMAHFSLFWDTLDILTVEKWDFFDFLFVLAGPILLFFSVTSLLEEGERRDAELGLAVPRQFFALLGLTQVWIVLLDLLFGAGVELATVLNGGVAVALLVTAKSIRPKLQLAVSFGIWLLLAITLGLRGSGVIA